jgi:hypothetical protein
MKYKKYDTVRTLPKYDRNILETETKKTHIYTIADSSGLMQKFKKKVAGLS